MASTASSDDDVFAPDSERSSRDATDASPANGVCRKLRQRPPSSEPSEKALLKKVKAVVDQSMHSPDDLLFLEENKNVVKLVKQRRSSYSKLKERLKEVEDPPEVLQRKAFVLADALRASSHAVLYTGAGISTSANIPDYRGPDGVWTKLQTGKSVTVDKSIVRARPTFAHMAIVRLVDLGLVKHVVSQNCDGLHIRSGLAPDRISEIHGNMFCERCESCGQSYYRIYDVTERTGLRRHHTNRTCDVCGSRLQDTIVHFGEKSWPSWPHNWPEAEANAEKADLILCLGSSLKVLRSYKQLWLTDRPKRSRPKLYIVNMQWTPKDSQADLKINGRADDVMRMVASYLRVEVPSSESSCDYLPRLATPTKASELETFRTRCIQLPPHLAVDYPECNVALTRKCVSEAPVRPLAAKSLSVPSCSSLASHDDDDDVWRESDSRVGVQVANDLPGWFGKGRKSGLKKCAKRRRRKATY